jgi:hypothetical protein
MSHEGTRSVPDVIDNRHHWDSGQTPLVGDSPGEIGDDDIRSTGMDAVSRYVCHHIEAERRQLVREARADFIVCDGEQDQRHDRVAAGRASDVVSMCRCAAHD